MSNPFVQGAVSIDRKAIAENTPGVASSAKWFWWIAGLSLVNTVMVHSGSQTSFVMGLGFTLLADVAFQSMKLIAFAVDAVAIGFFVGMGFAALRGHLWAFYVGAAFYTLDGLIYLYFEDYMPVAFHALALVYIVRGTMALRGALQAAEERAAQPPVVEEAPAGETPTR